MAATAEMLQSNLDQAEFDQKFLSITQSLGDVFEGYENAPGTEIYGRSLSTIRRLGAVAVDAESSPEAEQAKAEFSTSVEEGYGTDGERGGGLEVRVFDERQVRDGKVMCKDLKTPISAMTMAGLVCAQETAKKDSRFLPQLTRSWWDHHNQQVVDDMVQGKTDYNTRLVSSPFVEEAVAQSGEAYWRRVGYVPRYRRGFMQLFHWDGEKLLAGSLSFDGSNKQHLREIFSQFGVDIPEDEITDNWLKYAITGNMTAKAAKALATQIADLAGGPKPEKTNTADITHQHRQLMDRVFESSYVPACRSLVLGYQTEAVINLVHQFAHGAEHYNERYKKALYNMRANPRKFTDDDMVVIHELLVYSTIEMMRALHASEASVTEFSQDNWRSQTSGGLATIPDNIAFQSMLGGYGAAGAKQGHIYSACGLEIAPGQPNVADNPQLAFGLANDVEARMLGNSEEAYMGPRDKYGPRNFKCKYGHPNTRRFNELITQCCIPSCKDSVGCGAPAFSFLESIKRLFGDKTKNKDVK